MPTKTFFCYAHEDEAFLKKLKSHLSPLERDGLIQMWHDRDINAGFDWKREISEQLNAAQIILLLVSPNFISSDYCYSTEMKRALERQEQGEVYAIPIILRPTDWQHTPLGRLQALPKDGKPITLWDNRDEAYLDIAKGLRKTVSDREKTPIHVQYFSEEAHRQKIERLAVELRHYDIHPLYLPDVEDLYEENHLVRSLRDDLVADLSECLLSADNDEKQMTYETLDTFFKEQIDLDLFFQRDLQTAKNAAIYLLVTLVKQRYYDLTRYILGESKGQSDVLKIYPELAQFENEEGLIPFGTPHFVPAGVGGGVYYKDHVVHYHQFLRRNFTANLNFSFLNALVEYYKSHRDQFVAVAIDHFRLMPKEAFRQMFEKDRSFGPPLALPSLDDPQAVGLTIRRLMPRFIPLYNYERTEFYWSLSEGYKAFQVEEVYSLDHLPDTGKEYVLVRSIHSLRDIKNHEFIHLDGSVLVYLRNQYPERYEKTIKDEIQRVREIKVFRIDGKISDNDWSKLVGYFYQQNIMVAEYLNPNFLNT